MLLIAIAALLALADPSGQAVEARIADVIADPDHYDGQLLRLRGQVDACHGFTCSICPAEMTPATQDDGECLRISFDDFTSNEHGELDMPLTRIASKLVEELFRFSVITADGMYDAACQPRPPGRTNQGQRGGEEAIEEIVVCTDRASTWRGVGVREVHRRIPSNDGLIFNRPANRLSDAPTNVSDPVKAAYRDYVLTFEDEPNFDPMVVLMPEAPLLKPIGDEARLCVCLVDECAESDWPRRDVSTWARTPNDPYVCYVALKVAGAWRVYPE